MKVLHLYEVKMLDGTRYRGEIAYRDDQKVVIKTRNRFPQRKVRIYNNGIQSIRDVGFKKAYALR